jgi:hypothetical protein
LLAFQPVPFGAQLIDLIEHPVEQSLCRAGWYPRALELPDLTPLPVHLSPHAFDIAPNEINIWHRRQPE